MTHKPLVINGVEYDPSHIRCIHSNFATALSEELPSCFIVVFSHDEDGRLLNFWPDHLYRYRSERELLTTDKDVTTNYRVSWWEQTVYADCLPKGLGTIHYEPNVQGTTKRPDFGIGTYDDGGDCLTDGLLVECFVLQPDTQTAYRSHLGPGPEDKSWGGLGWRLYSRMVGKLEEYCGLPRGFRLVLAVYDMDSIRNDCLMDVLYGNRTPYLELDPKTEKVIHTGTKNLWLDPAYRQAGRTNLYPEGLFAAFSDLLYGVIYKTMGQDIVLTQNPFQPMGLPQFCKVTLHKAAREAPSKAPPRVQLHGASR